MKYIDSHAHLNDERLLIDIDNIINRSISNGCANIYNSADNYSSFKIIKDIQDKFPICKSVIGIHPEFASDYSNFVKAMKYIENNYLDISAIGEIGLDYHYNNDEEIKEKQKEIFIHQIRLAKKINLPIVIHSRDAFLDTFNILKEEKIDDIYFHCYSYSYGCYLEILSFFPKAKFGIGGVITFKNSKKLEEVVSKGNMESFLVETDCPYLAPEPFRGKTNDPSLIPYIIKKIAEIKNEDTEKISEILLNNSKEFYHE